MVLVGSGNVFDGCTQVEHTDSSSLASNAVFSCFIWFTSSLKFSTCSSSAYMYMYLQESMSFATIQQCLSTKDMEYLIVFLNLCKLLLHLFYVSCPLQYGLYIVEEIL